ncbi:sensor histidine kinase [Zobellia amurskyensis]|uniref:histidine kinase n=1 Tax=Zobellia amurskyensis TaxID=248905 RepID=A0A7X3D2M2_9FLAO|nr:sensor histidine kinase [Zobellia amurskyensis]MUH36621.1 sensor histidine kinase [Zobellia amurskyensis]
MPNKNKIQSRLDNQSSLLINFVYISAFVSFLVSLLLIYILGVIGYVPAMFLTYTVVNLINISLYKVHGKLLITSFISSAISLICIIVITLFSGAINSPFIFVLSIIVLGGYVSGHIFGKIYLTVVLLVTIGLYAASEFTSVPNEIPENVKDSFSLISILFCLYLLIGVFGKHLLKTHEKLTRSKSKIEEGIAEKELLLRTVHHRVKNNLQTVSSLLSLQSKNTTNAKIKELAISSQHRINSMAMIHEMLYMRDNISQIAFKPYLEELTNFLVKSANSKNLNVTVNIDMPDVSLGLDTTIPLGLLINEAVTNSLKYGFPENGSGKIDIMLKADENDAESYFLDITDDGIGFSEEINHKTTKSLGLKLMHNLGRQLRGSVSRIKTKKGTGYHITFKDKDRHLPSING